MNALWRSCWQIQATIHQICLADAMFEVMDQSGKINGSELKVWAMTHQVALKMSLATISRHYQRHYETNTPKLPNKKA